MWRTILMCVFSASAWGQSAVVDELAGEGVFGVRWSDDMSAVRTRYPDGRHSRAGEVEFWEVRDDRTIFEVKRRSLDTITFAYLADQLRSIGASFRGGYCRDVPAALEKFLGPRDPETVAEAISSGGSYFTMGKWLGSAYEIELAWRGNQCVLEFRPVAFEPVEATRQQLGLE